jgi:hypothetical protein
MEYKVMTEVLYAPGLRAPLVSRASASSSTAATTITTTTKLKNNRRETAMSHGFRKFFDTTCTNAGMDPIYTEFCLGHKLPCVKDSYFLPQPDSNGVYVDILEGNNGKSLGYIDAIDYLTIDNSQRLKRENEMLKVPKYEIQQLKEEFEQYKKDLIDQLRAEIEVSNSIMSENQKKGININDPKYSEDKTRLDTAIAKYAKEHNIDIG